MADRSPPHHGSPPYNEDFIKLNQDWRSLIIAELNRVRADIEKVQESVDQLDQTTHDMEMKIVSLGVSVIQNDVEKLIDKVYSLETFRTRTTTLAWIGWTLAGVALTVIGWLAGKR